MDIVNWLVKGSLVGAVMGFISCTPLFAYDIHETPKETSDKIPREFQDVGVTPKLGGQIDLDLEFTDEVGVKKTLRDFFVDDKPVLLSIVYYGCPSLCNYHLNGLNDLFKNMKNPLGKDFNFVAVSMNHREDSDLASEKKEAYIQALGQVDAGNHYHFLTGTEENIKTLADSVGFGFKWNEEEKQYAHAAVAYVVTPSGVISRYLYGIEFSPETLRLSVVEASNGKLGSVIDQLILFCYQFNPGKGKYTIYAYNIMRLGALLTVIVLGIFLIPLWLRARQERQA